MIWLLIVVSTGYYNGGTTTGIEFNSQTACIAAREEMKKVVGSEYSTKTLCVKKG
jgi:hypothetical protein